MGKHIVKFGFTPGYHQWIHHGEADRIREEVVRPWLEAFDDDVVGIFNITSYYIVIPNMMPKTKDKNNLHAMTLNRIYPQAHI